LEGKLAEELIREITKGIICQKLLIPSLLRPGLLKYLCLSLAFAPFKVYINFHLRATMKFEEIRSVRRYTSKRMKIAVERRKEGLHRRSGSMHWLPLIDTQDQMKNKTATK